MKKRWMHHVITGLFGLSCVSALAGCQNHSDEQAPAQITQITADKLSSDQENSEYSVLIHFTYQNIQSIDDWSIGFFFPRTLLTHGDVNANQQLEICNIDTNQCKSLVVEKTNIKQKDKTQGYFTMLAPNGHFTLSAGAHYVVKILHNNQWLPTNLSSVPQSFFLKTYPNGRDSQDTSNFYELSTSMDTYQLPEINQAQIDQSIEQHVADNWDNSQTKSSDQRPDNLNLIPSPQSVTGYDGSDGITLADTVTFNIDDSGFNNPNRVNDVVASFENYLASDLGVTVQSSGTDSDVLIQYDGALDKEAYQLVSDATGVTIKASTQAGVYYALQTLRQLWNMNPTIPQASIDDAPRFTYRGVLLDDSRHAFTVDQVKQLIDVMGAHKLNTLHLHLSDDEGFRLALDSIDPNLAGIGGIRQLGLLVGPAMLNQGSLDITNTANKTYPNAKTLYSGAFTPANIQTVIDYANQNQITVIPEIDLPGHARALIKSDVATFVNPNDTTEFLSTQGYTDDVMPVCRYEDGTPFGDQFTTKIDAILTKTADLFDGQTTVYAPVSKEVSVGGDEVSGQAWDSDPDCTGDWDGLNALQKSHLFFDKMQANTGLTFSGWQQFIQTDGDAIGSHAVAPANTGHVWVWNTTGDLESGGGMSQAIELANNDYPTVLAFADDNYFDLAYTPDKKEPGLYWATPYSDTQAALSSALDATTVLNNVDTGKADNIQGLEGTLWSEMLPTNRHLQYMAYPKMAGLAEAAWAPKAVTIDGSDQLNWQSLASRLGCGDTGFLHYLNKRFNVTYRGAPNGIIKEAPALCE